MEIQQTKSIIKSVIFSALIITLCGCKSGWPGCVEPRGIEGAGLGITFININNSKYTYSEDASESTFNLDSTEIKDSNGFVLRALKQLNGDIINPLIRYYKIEVYPIFMTEVDSDAFEQEMTKHIYIKHDFANADTLKLVYKSERGDCANKYQYLKVYHKDTLISETYNSYSQGLNFKLNR